MLQLRPKATHATGDLLSIQYLRGIAALTVLISHTLQWPLARMTDGLLRSGQMGVEVFFVISGFIITIISGNGAFDRSRFLWRRTLRLVPLYWAATTIVTVAALLFPALFRTTVPTPLGFFESLFFIPSVAPKAPLLGVGWTLDYEVFFYLLFAVLAGFGSELRTSLICMLLLLLMGIGLLLPHPGVLQYFYTSPSLLGFAMGTVLAQAYRHGLMTRLSQQPVTVLLAVPCLLLMVFFMVPAADMDGRWPLYFHIVMSAAAISIVGSALALEQAGRLKSVALLHYFGDASYSIYLFHLFAVSAGWAIAHRLWPAESMGLYIAVAILTSVAALGAGLAAHHLFERPLLDFFKRPRAKTGTEIILASVSPAV